MPPPPTRSQLERPTRLRLQCPLCNRAFGSATSLRQHRAALVGRTRCGSDVSHPMETGWSCRGPRAAGMAQDLRRAVRLAGLTDSDSDSNGSLAGEHGGHGDPGGRSPDPQPAEPAGGPAAPPPAADAGPIMPQVPVCIGMYRYVSVCIRMYLCFICMYPCTFVCMRMYLYVSVLYPCYICHVMRRALLDLLSRDHYPAQMHGCVSNTYYEWGGC